MNERAPVTGAPSATRVATDPVSELDEPVGLPRLEPGTLRQLRLDRGITQRQLVELLEDAHGLKLAQADVSRFERGLVGIRPDLQAALVAEFGQSVRFIEHIPARSASAMRCARRTTALVAQCVAAEEVRRLLMHEFGITSSRANSYLRGAGINQQAEKSELARRRAAIAVSHYKPGWRDQREIADRLGVSQATVFRYLSAAGVVCPPGAPELGLRARDGGALLRRARTDAGWSIRALAKRLAISHLIIVRLESIWDEGSGLETTARIAEALGHRVDDLFTHERPAAHLRGKPSHDPVPAAQRFNRSAQAVEQDETDLAEFKKQTGWWTAGETCEFMEESSGTLTRLRRQGRLVPEEHRSFGTRTFAFYCPRKVKQLMVARRDDPLVKLHQDPVFAKAWARSRDMAKPTQYARRAERRGEKHGRVRIDTGRRPGNHELDAKLLAAFDDIRVEKARKCEHGSCRGAIAEYRLRSNEGAIIGVYCRSHVGLWDAPFKERIVTAQQARLMVAREHRDLLRNDPDALPRAAADEVRSAIDRARRRATKSLQ